LVAQEAKTCQSAEFGTYQSEEDEKSGDVTDHSAERDLQRAEHLEGRHEVGRARDAQHIGDGEQDVGYDFWIVRLPFEPSCIDRHHTDMHQKLTRRVTGPWRPARDPDSRDVRYPQR